MEFVLRIWRALVVISYLFHVSCANDCTRDHSYYFDVATYILTQSALDDGPNRYKTYVEKAEDKLNSMTFPRKSSYSGCGVNFAIYGDQATKSITFNENQLSISITSTGFHIYAEFYLTLAVPVYLKICKDPLFGWDAVCFCVTFCKSGSEIRVSGTIKTSTDIVVTADNNGFLIFTYTPSVDTSSLYWDITDCSWLTRYFNFVDIDVQQKIDNAIQQGIKEYIEGLNTTYRDKQSYSPYDGLNTTYYVSNLEFQSLQYAKVSLKGVFFTTDAS